MDGFISSQRVLKDEITILTDWFTDELFDLPFSKVIAPFSRIFCDVERFENDNEEIMSSRGMGMCYTHTDGGKVMRNVTPSLKSEIATKYYRKHHFDFEMIVTEKLTERDKVLIIDCHSFPDKPMNRDLIQESPRPDFCIGTDEFHTSQELASFSVDYIKNNGYSVKINNPYSGSIVPLKYYQKNEKVQSLMIEINRKLYMKTENGEAIKTESFEKIKDFIANLIMEME
jgi:N-formylglutamate amidohydrolase